MMTGKTLSVRRGITQEECDYIGVPFAGVAGSLCFIDNVSSKNAGYRELAGYCEAYHVTFMSGPHDGSTWWLPPSFFEKECMFGDRA